MKHVLVAERMLYGVNCGRYQIYEADNPTLILRVVDPGYMSEFFDSCILNPLLGYQWTECIVKDSSGEYTVEFDDYYKREFAKDLLAKLVALNNQTTVDYGEDVVEDTGRLVDDNVDDLPAVEDILMDMLGVNYEYAWIFTEERSHLETRKASNTPVDTVANE